MKTIVIIGSGIAGYSLVKALRALDNQVPIILITKDNGDYYYKPLLSNALSNNQITDNLTWMSGQEMARRYSFQLLANCTVERIDAPHQVIYTDQKKVFYDQLVFACGANPRFPSFQIPQILTVNNLEDYKKFLAMLNNKEHITILGSGLIGCEFANDLIVSGFKVSIISLDTYPLQCFIPKMVGTALKHQLSSIGVQWHLSTQIISANPKQAALELQLSNETIITTDLVLSAIGLLPNIQLAKNAGISTNQGIVVNAYLRTNYPNIYSLGDCAEIEGQIWPFVIPIRRGSQALAKTLLGTPTALSLNHLLISVKTPIYPITFCGDLNNTTYQSQFQEDEKGIKGLYRDNAGRCKAFILTKQAVLDSALLLKEMVA